MSARKTAKNRKKRVPMTVARKKRVLELLRDGDFINAIADIVGVTRQTLYYHKEADPEFAADWKKAEAIGQQIQLNATEEEMDFRGRIGWIEPKFYEGRVCGYVPRFSNALLLARAKALAPEKYGDRTKIDATVNTAPDIKIEFISAHETDDPT